ncbi:MAG: proton-conducting transporter membrane subunit [Minicystis sp.]
MRTASLFLLWLVPLAAGLLLSVLGARRFTRAWALAVSLLVLAASVVVFVSTEQSTLAGFPGIRALAVTGLAVDGLSAVLLPLTSAIATAVLLAAPRADLDARTASRVLVIEALVLGVLVSANILMVAGFWIASLWPLFADARASRDPALRRATRWLVVATALPLIIATAATAWLGLRAGVRPPFAVGALVDSGALRDAPSWVGALFVLGAVARMGVFPLHLWLPVVFERGRLPLVIPTIVSPLGSFALARLGLSLFPAAMDTLRPALLITGAVSALYGALLALGQHNARRQLGFLYVSIAGFLLAGLASPEPQGVSGALFHDVAVTLAITGLFAILRGVEARTGTLDMRRLGGLVSRVPQMATGYLLVGLATVGFPGTATFVSEDLLVQGLLHEHAVATVLLLGATALNGVSLLRSFKRIFLGPPAIHAPALGHVEDLLPRERLVALAFIACLLAGGFVPTPLLAIREGVVMGSAPRAGESPAHAP